jgi:hypothetical protein
MTRPVYDEARQTSVLLMGDPVDDGYFHCDFVTCSQCAIVPGREYLNFSFSSGGGDPQQMISTQSYSLSTLFNTASQTANYFGRDAGTSTFWHDPAMTFAGGIVQLDGGEYSLSLTGTRGTPPAQCPTCFGISLTCSGTGTIP